MKHIIRSSTGVLAAGLIAAACSTAPPASEVAAAETALSNAGQAVDRAAADPHVAKYTSSELDRATDTLKKAQAAWKDKHDVTAATHLAYLAQQRAATAQELANGRASEDALVVAAANRDQVMSTAMAERPAKPAAPAAPTESTVQLQQGLGGFAFGGTTVPSTALPAIDQLAAKLNENPGSKVVIEGYTDSVGSAAYNQTLAMERAQAVRSALVRRGVDVHRITVLAQGEENPVASNDTRAGRRENRRAQVIVGDMGESMVGSSQGSTSATSSGQGEQSGQSGQKGQSGQSGQSGQDSRNEH